MGWLDDIKQDVAEAKGSRDLISPVPAQRLDTVVADPVSGAQRRRTDYAGTVWFGGRPEPGQPRPAGYTEIKNPFWLPDSHVYESSAAADAQIQASAAVQSALILSGGGGLQIFEVSAALGEDARTAGALRVYLAVTGAAELPLGVAYRVTVICAPEAVRAPTA